MAYLLQGLTVDSMIPEGANPRVIDGEVVPDIEQYYATHDPAHLQAANALVLPKPASLLSANPVMGEAGLAEL